MIKLTLCFAIVNLALAHGLYGFTKKYDYPHGSNLIIPDEPYGDHKLVYAVCKDHGAKKVCKIYQELIQDESNAAVWSCDVKLKNSTSLVDMHNADRTHVVLTVKDGHMVKLLNLNMGMCKIKETIIEADVHKAVKIVPIGALSYDVIFENHRLCGQFYCIASFNLDGMLVRKVVPFGLKTGHEIKVSHGENNYLVMETIDTGYGYDRMNLWVIRDSDFKATLLHTTTPTDAAWRHLFSSSVAKWKSSFCMPMTWPAQMYGDIQCQQFTADGKIKIMQVWDNILSHNSWASISVLNRQKGLMMLVRELNKFSPISHGLPADRVRVGVYDEQGKLTKTFYDVDVCRYGRLEMFENLGGDACITSICLDTEAQAHRFSRSYQCIPKYQLE